MNKILALDPGDQWVGTALSDTSQTFALPYQTIALSDFNLFLTNLFKQQDITTIVVGYPKTLAGRESSQTLKAVALKEELETKFPDKQFILWDERLSSKFAHEGRSIKTKEDKMKVHSRAAAFILDSYLIFLKTKSE